MNDSTQKNSTCFIPQSTEMVLRMLYLGGGSVSLVFCLAIFFITILFHKYRQTTQRVTLYLTISVSLLSIANILHGTRLGSIKNNNDYCVTVGFIDQITSWMVLLAVTCLTIDLFIKVVFLRSNTSTFEPVYCLIIFVFPFTFNWIPFIKQAYGLSGEQCWLKLFKNNTCEIDDYYLSLRFVLYWIPFLLVMLFVFVTYVYVLIRTRKQLNEYSGNYNPAASTTKQLLYTELRTYLMYPFIMLVSFVTAVISRIVEVADPSRPYFGLRLIHILAVSLQGVAIAMVFALDYDTRKQLSQCYSIRRACHALICCCNRPKVVEYEARNVSITDSLRYEETPYYYGSNQQRKDDVQKLI